MSRPVFLVGPGELDGPPDVVELGGEEGRHAAVVRRIRVGEQVELADGRGVLARCEVEQVGRERLTCRVLGVERHPAPSPQVVVVQALPKGDRGELAVELLTEVGVDEVVPWAAARCVTQWRGDRTAKGLRRWRSTAREAAKQARRPWVPAVAEPVSTAEVAARLAAADLALVLHEGAGTPLSAVRTPGSGRLVVVVGPEGGVAPRELDAFATAGATAVRLGPSVLRTSTAGAVAAGVLLSRTARWA